MRGVHLFMFVVALPAIVALGHDFYLFYANYGVDSVIRDFNQQVELKGFTSLFASLGFIWTHYGPESYKMTVESLEPEQWARINSLLEYKAVLAGAAFAGGFYVLLGLLKLLGVWPFSGEGTFSKSDGPRKKPGKMKYKRK